MCLLPSLPWVTPPARPMYWARIYCGVNPRMKNSPMSR
jgi:hypothetical protein